MNFRKIFKRKNYFALSDAQKEIYHLFDADREDTGRDLLADPEDVIRRMITPQTRDTRILKELLAFGNRQGRIADPGKYPMMPELLEIRQNTAMSIDIRIRERETEKPPEEQQRISAEWCVYMGMAHVRMCRISWEALQNLGMIGALEHFGGFDHADEYAIRELNIRDGEAFRNHIREAAEISTAAMKDFDGTPVYQWRECVSAMYMYGMAIAMQQMGMMKYV